MSEQLYSEVCAICGSTKWSVLYHGHIRKGKFGSSLEGKQSVWQCEQCKAGFLPLPKIDYHTSEYRELVDGESTPESYYSIHDKEQAENLSTLGTDTLRGKVIADIGCGAGSFLDLVRGFAQDTLAIEPCPPFQKTLKENGHNVFSYAQEASSQWQEKVDIAVSFAVLEHIENPLEFLKSIKTLLKPGGSLLLSTPNYDDWMIRFLPETYGSFFFRSVHKWYFNRESISNLASFAGFKKTEVQFKQRFDISNALLWTRDSKPTGLGKINLLSGIEGAYKQRIEEQGQSDFLFAMLTL